MRGRVHCVVIVSMYWRTQLELFYCAMLGGLVGTVMMDGTGKIAGLLKIPWGG